MTDVREEPSGEQPAAPAAVGGDDLAAAEAAGRVRLVDAGVPPARARRLPRHAAPAPGRLRQLPQAHPEATDRPARARRPGTGREAAPRPGRGRTRGRPRRRRGRRARRRPARRHPRQGGPRADRRPYRAPPSIRPSTRRSPTSRGTARPAGDRRAAARRLPVEGRAAAAGDGQGPRLRSEPVAQATREWFEKDYYKVLGVPTDASERRHPARLSQAGQAVPPRRKPG